MNPIVKHTAYRHGLVAALSVVALFALDGCRVVGDIFKAGFAVAVIAIVGVLAIGALIVSLIRK